jgi:hypothetical protein
VGRRYPRAPGACLGRLVTDKETLAAIMALAPPPPPPERYGLPVDWERFAMENGFLPPSDFRAVLEAYGAGGFESGLGGLYIEQPLHRDRSFLEGNRWIRDALRGFQVKAPAMFPPWPIYPDEGGFLPFASDETSWTVGWLTRGEPDAWTAAIDGGRDGWWAEISIGALELIRRWATGDLGISEVEPRPGAATFHPLTKDAYWSARTESATVTFAPSPESTDFRRFSTDWFKLRIGPARLQSYGVRGDARTPVHLELGIGYAPGEAAEVISAMGRLANELRTRVSSVTALDATPIWPELTDTP